MSHKVPLHICIGVMSAMNVTHASPTVDTAHRQQEQATSKNAQSNSQKPQHNQHHLSPPTGATPEQWTTRNKNEAEPVGGANKAGCIQNSCPYPTSRPSQPRFCWLTCWLTRSCLLFE
mmetsp:Transcript_124356/g.243863  ORF Transcript_124356/g.243863 Transcript_124356/m.243863 type:complete len:118 (-) Transcript_124356:164-517(-)